MPVTMLPSITTGPGQSETILTSRPWGRARTACSRHWTTPRGRGGQTTTVMPGRLKACTAMLCASSEQHPFIIKSNKQIFKCKRTERKRSAPVPGVPLSPNTIQMWRVLGQCPVASGQHPPASSAAEAGVRRPVAAPAPPPRLWWQGRSWAEVGTGTHRNTPPAIVPVRGYFKTCKHSLDVEI